MGCFYCTHDVFWRLTQQLWTVTFANGPHRPLPPPLSEILTVSVLSWDSLDSSASRADDTLLRVCNIVYASQFAYGCTRMQLSVDGRMKFLQAWIRTCMS